MTNPFELGPSTKISFPVEGMPVKKITTNSSSGEPPQPVNFAPRAIPLDVLPISIPVVKTPDSGSSKKTLTEPLPPRQSTPDPKIREQLLLLQGKNPDYLDASSKIKSSQNVHKQINEIHK
jgi:hypothetical protein